MDPPSLLQSLDRAPDPRPRVAAALDGAGAVADAGTGCRLEYVLGLDMARRHNMVALDGETLALAAGGALLLLHLPSMTQRHLSSRDGGGIGAVALHPKRTCFAVAEKCQGRPPNIYVYEWPSLAVAAVLPSGTDHAYTAAAFDAEGGLLAAVGGAPDYALTLWSWRDASVVLRAKAFSQEVYGVRFSPFASGRLVTSGTGHIRFWRMASTFTGLKLQGALGKFGALELSDIAAFVELPDGKVLSGSEGGALLLWDAGSIKALVARPGGAPCHGGAVEALVHDEATDYVLSGGADGVLRLWEMGRIDTEPPEAAAPGASSGGGGGGGGSVGAPVVVVKPSAEVVLPAGVRVRCLLWLDRRTWLVADDAGGLLRVSVPLNLLDAGAYACTRFFDCHAGCVAGVAALPGCHVAVTAGADGSVRAVAYTSGATLQARRFGSPATCMTPLAAEGTRCCLAIGFGDGSVRRVQRCSDGWLLLGAQRPHKASVVAVAVARGAACAATVAADSTVFFFSSPSPEQWDPLGFYCLPAASGTPTCADWAPGGKRLVVGCSSGIVVEITAPGVDNDTTSSYRLQLPVRTCTIKLPRRLPSLQQSAGTAGGDVTRADGTGTSEGSSSQQVDSGPADAADGLVAAAATSSRLADMEQDCWAGDSLPAPPVTWLQVPSADDGCFCFCLGGRGAGRVWNCGFDSPVPRCCGPSIASAPTTIITTSHSGRFRLLGSVDGTVRVEAAGGAAGLLGDSCWESRLHDMQTGSVTGLSMAFDDSALISAARDGTLMVTNVSSLGKCRRQPGQDAPLATVAESRIPQALDLAAGAPTFEEGKQAAVADALAEQAAQARQGLRGDFEALRDDFVALLEANSSCPPGHQLPHSAFDIDPGLLALAESERSTKLEDAQAQVAWDAEVAASLLQRLQVFFSAQLASTNFVLRPVSEQGQPVESLTLPALPPEVQAETQSSLSLLHDSDDTSESATGCGGKARSLRHERSKPQQQVSIDHRAAGVGGRVGGESSVAAGAGGLDTSPSAASKVNLRRAARKEREAQWAALMASKPDDAFEAPEDVAALRVAAATIGDLRLRSAPDYVPDEDQRMTPQRKRQQMALLARRAARACTAFNRDLLDLRDGKRRLLQKLESLSARLKAIDEQLGAPVAGSTPTMAPDEEPEERRSSISLQQLTEHTARKQAKKQRKEGVPSAGGLGGFAAAGANSKTSQGGSGTTTQGAATAGTVALLASPLPPSGLEQAEAAALRIRLEAERRELQLQSDELCCSFDAALARLRGQRLELACSLSSFQARQLVHYQELQLLKDFEARELVLLAKCSDKTAERDELQGRVAELGRQLDAKRAEAESIAAARAAAVAEFDSLIPESHAFHDQLAHIFNKKLKRSSKRAGAAMRDDASSASDDDDDLDAADEDGGDDLDDDGGGGAEVCPPGCEQGLYDKVCELREQRLDEEDAGADVAKQAEGVRKEREVLAKKGRVIEQSLSAINQDMLEFQKEKQARLNEVPVEVALRAHQVQYLDEQRPPLDGSLADALVIPQTSLATLSLRIQGLEDEKGALRLAQKDLRRKHVQLAEERAAKDEHVLEQRARCRDVQMLKFGHEIDIALLDTIGARNRAADELRRALKEQEGVHAQQLVELEMQAAARGQELLVLTRDNTAALNTVSELTRSQRGLEAEVLSHKAGLFDDQLETRRAAVAERDALVTTVTSNANVLQQLRSAKNALKHKATLLYT